MFTDNVNEPKKINIPRSIQGTTSVSDQTKLVVNGAVTDKAVEDYHITVIKKSPKYPPVLEMSDGRRFDPLYPDRKISGTLNIDFDGNEAGDSVTLDATTFTDYSAGDYYDFRVNDILVLRYYEDNVHLTPLTEWEVKLEVDTVTTAGTAFTTSIISISNSTPVGLDNVTNLAPSFVIDLFEPIEKMFEFKFPRFAYRWVYEDKEYSTFSPFSEVAFLPGNFDYHPKKGYIYEEKDDVAEAKDDLVSIEVEMEALNTAMAIDVDKAEAILRVELGSSVDNMSSAELKRDLYMFARNNPTLFLDLVNDENVELRNLAIKAQSLGVIKLSQDQRTFMWGSNDRKLMNVPFDEHPYSALAAWFKTDEGMEIYSNIEKRMD